MHKIDPTAALEPAAFAATALRAGIADKTAKAPENLWFSGAFGAGNQTRTDDLLITKIGDTERIGAFVSKWSGLGRFEQRWDAVHSATSTG